MYYSTLNFNVSVKPLWLNWDNTWDEVSSDPERLSSDFEITTSWINLESNER